MGYRRGRGTDGRDEPQEKDWDEELDEAYADDHPGDDEVAEPAGGGGPSKKWIVGLLVVIVAAAGAFALYDQGVGRTDVEAFCLAAERIAEVPQPSIDPEATEQNRQGAVRVTAARLILLNEDLLEHAPAGVRTDLSQLIEDYRAVVRSGSEEDLRQARDSASRRNVEAAVTSECAAD